MNVDQALLISAGPNPRYSSASSRETFYLARFGVNAVFVAYRYRAYWLIAAFAKAITCEAAVRACALSSASKRSVGASLSLG